MAEARIERLKRLVRRSLCCLLCWLPLSVSAEIATIGLDELRPDMDGYGVSVFKGVKPIRFPVRFIDVMRSEWPASPVFLIKAIHTKQTFPNGMVLGSGFSGSPIYFDNRLAGAFSFMELFQSENILGVTPIGAMLKELDKAKEYYAKRSPLPSPLTEMPNPQALPIPGSMIEITWVRGDIWAGSSGTVTAVDGDLVLAFGHENLFIGDSVLLPLYSARVSEILPRLDLSHKITNPVAEVGAIIWDGKQAVVGKIGIKAPMIPATFSYCAQTDPVRTSYQVEIAADVRIIPGAIKSVMASIVDFKAHNTPNDSAIEAAYRIKLEQREEAIVFSQRHDIRSLRKVGSDSIEDGYRLLFQHLLHDDAPERIEVSLTEMADGRQSVIRKAYFSKTKARPGELVTLYVELLNELEIRRLEQIELRIPPNYKANVFPVLVTCGDSVSPFESLPESKNEIIKAVSNLLRSDDLVVLHPAGRDKAPFFVSANIQRTVKRTPWSVQGQIETGIQVIGN